jgi:multiple sugar transport system ATP-binding protein
MSDLSLNNVVKNFGLVEVIKGVDLDIKHGEFVVFVGPSGCGKSTLLRMIAGLEAITSGDVVIDGKRCNDVEARDRGVAMVFQSYALYPHMSVRDNIGFSLKLARVPKAEREAAVGEVARSLQLDQLLDRKPAQLSGGQRQRVAIGRAIVRKPKVFLFDEPLSNLDAALRVDMRMELSRLHHTLGATMIFVTHDQVEAMTLADRIVVLDQGVVQQVGSPLDLYRRPANKFVAGFIGSPKMNFLEAEVVSTDAGATQLQLGDGPVMALSGVSQGLGAGDRVTLGVRPHDVTTPADGLPALTGRVELSERLGHETVLTLTLPNGKKLTVMAPGEVEAEIGDDYAFSLNPERAHLFGQDGLRLN